MEIIDNTLKTVDESDIVNGTIVIPNNIKIIEKEVFKGLTGLTHIVIPDSVRHIDASAFEDCVNLKSVKLSNKLQSIAKSLFRNCSSLEEIDIPESVIFIHDRAFYDCKSLKEFKIPEKVLSIDDCVFWGCENLKKVEFHENIKKIGSYSFYYCRNLKNVDLSHTKLEYIGDKAFDSCYGLESAKLPNFVQELGEGIFYSCKQLKEFTFPKGPLTIPEYMFAFCDSLKKVHISGIIGIIEKDAFAYCDSLEDINIPSFVHTIDDCAFECCYGLKNFDFPNNLDYIGKRAFRACYNLKDVNFCDKLEEIGDEAFLDCTALNDVEFPKSLKIIGNDAFTNCNSFTKFSIPLSVSEPGKFYSRKFPYVIKTDTDFDYLESSVPGAIPTKDLGLSLKFLRKAWGNHDKPLKEQANPLIADFYSTFISQLNNQEISDFINDHNFTFLKRQKPLIEYYARKNIDEVDLYNFMYNIGVLQNPNSVNNNKVNYAQKISGFLEEKFNQDNDFMSGIKLNEMYSDGFKPEFTEFFMKNFDELISLERSENGFITKCYNEFEEVQKTNTNHHGEQRQLKASVEKFRNYFAKNKFAGVTDETAPIARVISPYFNDQEDFDHAVSIYNEKKKLKTPDHILKTPLSEKSVFANIDDYSSKISDVQRQILGNFAEISTNEFTFEWLSKNDPENFILGKFCSCCAHLKGAGYGIMHASIIHPNVQNLVIRNKKGLIVAKSTLFINPKKGYGVCNNVEVNTLATKEDKAKIYQKYLLGIQNFAREYNKEHLIHKLKQINVGMHLNDLEDEIEDNRKRSFRLFKPLNYGKYCLEGHGYRGDSYESQYVIWSSEEDKKLAKVGSEPENK